MTTQAIEIQKNTWIQVTNLSKSGTIFLRKGSVAFTESILEPAQAASEIAWSGALSHVGDSGAYVDVAVGEFVWAYAFEDSIIDVSPKGDL